MEINKENKVSYVMFQDMFIRLEYPIEIDNRSEDICNRSYELLKGIKEGDDWTTEMDALFKKYGVLYRKATGEEFKNYMMEGQKKGKIFIDARL